MSICVSKKCRVCLGEIFEVFGFVGFSNTATEKTLKDETEGLERSMLFGQTHVTLANLPNIILGWLHF